MKIGGVQRISLIDYPGRIGTILFTQGCNFRCPYCHNPELVDPGRYGAETPVEEVWSFLEQRRGKIEAVVVSGGEPTLQKELPDFLEKIKAMGYLTKVDTNGSQPAVLERLIRDKLVDYLAMDVKGPLERYEAIVSAAADTARIAESMALILDSGIDHEFRTTVVRSQMRLDELPTLAKKIKNARLYVLQSFVASKVLDAAFLSEESYSSEEFAGVRADLEKEVRCVLFR